MEGNSLCYLQLSHSFIFTFSTLLEDILLPLSAVWQHGDLLNRLRESVILFKPEVSFPVSISLSILTKYIKAFPAIYNWTTYPLTCLIECIFEQALTSNDNLKNDPLLVEICLVTERALNYMHTGNAAVIATSVMNPLWIGLAIIQDGQPSFNPNYLVTAHGTRVKVVPEVWPYNKKRHQPLSSSRRSQVLTYGEAYFNVSSYFVLIYSFLSSQKCANRKASTGSLYNIYFSSCLKALDMESICYSQSAPFNAF